MVVFKQEKDGKTIQKKIPESELKAFQEEKIQQEKTKKNSAVKTEGTKTEQTEAKPTIIEDIAEKLNKEKEARESQIKDAKNELIDLAKNINEAREKKETKTETSLYEKAKEVFETATGKNLEKTAKERAKTEAEREGFKIVNPEEYRKQKTTETQDMIRQKERSVIIKERWDILSEKEKAKYIKYFGEDKNGLVNIDSVIIKFAAKLKEKIDAKRQELAKGKNGINISEDVFYELMRKGLKSEDIKRRGFFGRIFYGGEITIPPLDKTDGRGPLVSDKEYLTEEIENRVKKNIEEAAKEAIEKKIIEGQKRWRGRKRRHTGEIIQETATGFQMELQPKIEYQPKTEPQKEFSPETTEEPKPLKKARKKVESGIEAKKKKPKTNKKVTKNKTTKIS